ncbi:unnamed protein product [Paramecium sonneborni]|uniref:Uncharacterized protein n=1 Tax=Paramecium sonneborni TaxID=65129 RepID=A0A8S1QW02_9CILI|nr:unnamed protein product [Paramecium sonneborni]
MLKKNNIKLQDLKPKQQDKQKAAIKQNKVEQSQIKASLFAKYYKKKRCDATAFISTKDEKCQDIIKEYDQKLLENDQSTITDYKKFIEDYANKTILNIKDLITKDHQDKLKQDLQNYLYVTQQKIHSISLQLQTQQKEGLKTREYFETSVDKNADLEFEKCLKLQKTVFSKKKANTEIQFSLFIRHIFKRTYPKIFLLKQILHCCHLQIKKFKHQSPIYQNYQSQLHNNSINGKMKNLIYLIFKYRIILIRLHQYDWMQRILSIMQKKMRQTQ